METSQRQFFGLRMWFETPEIADHGHRAFARQTALFSIFTALAMTNRGREIQPVDKGVQRLPENNQHFTGGTSDFGSPACPRQSDRRTSIRADHRRIDVSEAINLRSPQKPDVDPSTLKPIGKNL